MRDSLFNIDFISMSKLTMADICVPMLNYTEPVGHRGGKPLKLKLQYIDRFVGFLV